MSSTGFHFSAKVLDVYKLEIKAEREADPAPEGSIPF